MTVRRVDPICMLPALAFAALVFVAAPAAAEIFACTGPNGEKFFTSDKGACPRAERHAPSRDVQRMQDGSPAPAPGGDAAAPAGAQPAPAAPRAEEAPSGEEAQAAVWRRKRADAEQELRDLERNFDEYQEIVKWCNRGGDLYLEDKVGVRKDYDCDDAQESYEKISKRVGELRTYLAGGLEDECRRAGCLPGWIR
jgi:hypothetical protein